ncbi:MAG: hypothetical protein IKQ91_11410 [Oscillospiraceae bacterium]|nr:hypothetical protein [Oscillospiraceae bacterium]
MQRTYFLGGASPQGFETDFWREQQALYGFYLKGGPGTGKSTLMKKIAAAFSGEETAVYHCASDPRSLDAVVLPARGIFIADSTAPHEASTPLPFVTGETVDLAAALAQEPLQKASTDILALYRANQTAHAQVKKGLAGIAEMEDMIAETGAAALLQDRLEKYAARLAKRLFPKKNGCEGHLLYRQSAALTPLGRMRFLPESFDLILLHDPYYAAGALLLHQLCAAAVQSGLSCEITRSLTQKHRPPVQIILPEQRLMIAAVTEAAQPELPAPVSTLHLQRFYDAEVLRRQRTLLKFSAKTAAATEDQVIALLAEALRLHDLLENYYIGALNTDFLGQQTDRLISEILRRGQ